MLLLVVAVRRRPRITTSTKRCGGSATGSRCRRTEETCGTEFQHQRRYGACRPSRRSRFERAVRTGVLRPLPNNNNNVLPRQQRIRRSQTRRRRHSNRNDQLHRRRGMTNRITTAEHGIAKWPRRVTRITESTTIRIQQQQKQTETTMQAYHPLARTVVPCYCESSPWNAKYDFDSGKKRGGGPVFRHPTDLPFRNWRSRVLTLRAPATTALETKKQQYETTITTTTIIITRDFIQHCTDTTNYHHLMGKRQMDHRQHRRRHGDGSTSSTIPLLFLIPPRLAHPVHNGVARACFRPSWKPRARPAAPHPTTHRPSRKNNDNHPFRSSTTTAAPRPPPVNRSAPKTTAKLPLLGDPAHHH